MSENTTINFPPGTPLMAKTGEAVKLFGLSRTTLYRLRRDNAEFRDMTIKAGKNVLFDVPGVYRWLQQYGGGELDK